MPASQAGDAGSTPVRSTCYAGWMKREDLCWLAGLLEGEGSFMRGPPSKPHQPAVAVQMTDRDVIARVAVLLGVKYHKSLRASWKPIFCCLTRGQPAVDLMLKLRPLMGARRQHQINRAVRSFKVKRVCKLDARKVRAIRRRLTTNETIVSIASSFDVAHYTIRAIRDGVIYKHVA